MALTYQQAVEQTIIGAEQFHEIINGSATSEIVVEDGSKIPSARKALIDNFYYKDPIDWQQGQSELVFNQIRKFTDGTWWIAPTSTATNPVVMGVTPYGDPLWKVFSWDRAIDSQKANRKLIERSWAEAGYNVVAGSFQEGATLNTTTDVIINYGTDFGVYSWGGTLPKVVSANSDPYSSGVGPTSWIPMGDKSLRLQLSSPAGPISFSYNGLRDFVSVKDFGAVGDGVTDDTAAFSAAIDYIIRFDVGGGDYSNRIFGRKLYVPSGTYEIKNKISKSLGFIQSLIIEGDSEITTMISVNNPEGFLDITATGRAVTLEVNSISFLAKWGTSSSQPGIGRDDLPNTIADVHDIPTGPAIKMTFPTGISTVKSKSLKMKNVILTGWNRTRGDFFSEGIYLVGGRAPKLESVVVEGKYGYFLSGKPDSLYSTGTAFKFVDTYSPMLLDCYCNHYVRGLDLTSTSSDPSFSTSEGGIIQNGAFDAMYGLRINLPSINGEPGFIINNQHFNYSKIGIEMRGKNQVQIKNCLFYCEGTVTTTARDILLYGAQKSTIEGNIFGKTNVGSRFCITLDKNGTGLLTSCSINNNLYWAGGTSSFRNYNIAGAGAVSNVTIGGGECYEGALSNLFTVNGYYTSVNPIRVAGIGTPEAIVWAPLGSLYTDKVTGTLYKKGGSIATSNGWSIIP